MDGYALRPLEGGFSGETYLGDAGGERTVVRVYTGRGSRRGPDAVLVDVAVLSLVRGLVPVPQVLEARRPTRDEPGVLVTSFLRGERLDLLLPRLDEEGLVTVGTNLGRILGRLATIPMMDGGLFLGPELAVDPFDLDLVDWVDTHPLQWSDEEAVALRAIAGHAQQLLDRVGRFSLVHGDFNAKNLVVDAATHEVAGVLDWEFAHAGSPYADLGNLVRFERAPGFVDAVVGAFERGTPPAPAPVLDLARAADLAALVDLAARRGENPVTERADRLLRAIAETGDLHAVPPS